MARRPVEPLRELDQDVVALYEDALKDAGDGVRDGGVDLEPGGLETLAPLAQVEELEHSGLLVTLGMARGDAAEPSVTDEQHPSAHTHRERGEGQHGEGEEQRGFAVHGGSGYRNAA